ncbi:hypothetical protein ACH436_04110 [Isoptericola sp. NPDC019693]
MPYASSDRQADTGRRPVVPARSLRAGTLGNEHKRPEGGSTA